MPFVRDVLKALEEVAPARFAGAWDKIGLQVGDPDAKVTRAVVSLDRSLGAVKEATRLGAELLLSHHPLIFAPLATVDTRRHDSRTVLALAQNHINFIAAHTNWDAAQGGINDALAQRLGLQDVKSFGSAEPVTDLLLSFTVPESSADKVIDAVANAGAGQVGLYQRCAFSHEGIGTFEPLPGANPTEGQIGTRSQVPEMRVEMALPERSQRAVVRALLAAHPYEAPSYHVIAQRSHPEQPYGRVGLLERPMRLREWIQSVDQVLDTRSWVWGDPTKMIKRVAVVGGAADGEWIAAQRADADVLVTGEVKQHIGLEANESGLVITASGHYATEQPGVEALALRMSLAMPEIQWEVYSPPSGTSGRPWNL